MGKPSLTIVKVGGRVVDQARDRDQLVKNFARIQGLKILVHGGGSQASVLCEKLAIPVKMHQGRRITDKPTMEVVTMVYAGLINKTLVAELQAHGINALGLSGADLNSIEAKKRPIGKVDYGFAGDIQRVNADLIGTLLNTQISPVFCSITHDGLGQLLNTNADTIAAQLTHAMSDQFQVRLCLCLDKGGVLNEKEEIIPQLDQQLYQQLKMQSVIRDGMIPKLDNAFSVVENSGAGVFICGLQNLVEGGGTEVILV